MEIVDKVMDVKAILVGQVCFDEAVEAATDVIGKSPHSQWSKTALSDGQAVNLRLEQWGSENSERVDLAAVAKRIVKSDLPELKFETSNGADIRFKKTLTAGTEIVVVFSKSIPRFGKAFTIRIGLQSTDASIPRIRYETNLFSLERTTEERSWIYTTRAEADASVRIATDAIKHLLPIFESALLSQFNPWPTEYPKLVKHNGSITAKQAFDLALPLVRDLLSDAHLIGISSAMRSLKVRDADGPELSMNGRLRENGMWSLHFYSKIQDKSVDVSVPAVGRIKIRDHGNKYKDVNSRHILVPINQAWIDSDEAFAIAERNGGQGRRSTGKIFGVRIMLNKWKYPSACWELEYLVTSETERNDFNTRIDAITGEFTLIPHPNERNRS